jgi:hypothetical protein
MSQDQLHWLKLAGIALVLPSPTSSAKPDEVWAASQLWILKGERFWIVYAHGYGKRFIVRAEEKLTAFSYQTHRELVYRPLQFHRLVDAESDG